MRAATNLAARPFLNERRPRFIAFALLAAGLVTSVIQWRVGRELVSGSEARTVQQVRADESRIAELEAALAAEPPLRIETPERARLLAFKQIVDGRVFPWRGLLLALEEALPPDVRLSRIAPTGSRATGRMIVQLGGEARNKDAAFSFAEALGASPAFANPVVSALSSLDSNVRFEMQLEYRGRSTPRPSPSPSPVPAATASKVTP